MRRVIWGLAAVSLALAGLSRMNTAVPDTASMQARATFGLGAGALLGMYLDDAPQVRATPLPPRPAAARVGYLQMGDVCCPGISSRHQTNIATGDRLN